MPKLLLFIFAALTILFIASIYILDEKSPGIPRKLVKSKLPTQRQSTPSNDAIFSTLFNPIFYSI